MAGPSRILFVDDELQILDSFRFALRRYKEDWEVHTASSGEIALATLKEHPFDIVVSDMRMPEMDGATLLRRVKEQQPDVIRLVLSADAGQEALLRSISVAHQYFQKPCSMAKLRAALDRIRSVRALLGAPEMRRIAGDLEAVPSVPALVDELEHECAAPSSGTKDFTRVIERDIGMSAKVLQLAGSGFFGAGEPATKVAEAVASLGTQLLRTLTRSAGAFEKLTVEGFDAPALLTRSRLVAALSARIVGEGPAAEVAFTAAMLHDIGQLVLAVRMPEPFGRALAVARAERRPLHQVEQEILGTDHAILGGYILGIWGLPAPLVDTVTSHLQPERAQPAQLNPLVAVHIAESLIGETRADAGPACLPISPSIFALAAVQERVSEWRALAREIVADAAR